MANRKCGARLGRQRPNDMEIYGDIKGARKTKTQKGGVKKRGREGATL